MVAVGLSPRTAANQTTRRRGATAERSNSTVAFKRRSATHSHNTPYPWTEVHGHHGLAPRGVAAFQPPDCGAAYLWSSVSTASTSSRPRTPRYRITPWESSTQTSGQPRTFQFLVIGPLRLSRNEGQVIPYFSTSAFAFVRSSSPYTPRNAKGFPLI